MKMVGVIGAGSCDEKIYEMARSVGAGIAKTGATLVCGGPRWGYGRSVSRRL